MIYPKFLSKNDTIGITAPSDGITEKTDIIRLNNAISQFEKRGYKIKETPDVRTSTLGKSASSKIQARELESLYQDERTKGIICAGGGDFLLEMLSEVNFDIIKNNPKWLQGYSDPTGLLYTITTNLDIATIYADNFKSFGMEKWHKSLENNLKILEGNLILQESFDKYESTRSDKITGKEGYNLDKEVKWENLNKEEINVTGRMIGGCLDILTEIFGTRFDKTKEFIERYKNDGIVWYLENCEMTSESIIRTLWKFKDNGWFENTNGIIFGRSGFEQSSYGISFKDAVIRVLGDLNIPIIFNADIGHVSPRMTIINGAMCKVISKDGKGKITFELK